MFQRLQDLIGAKLSTEFLDKFSIDPTTSVLSLGSSLTSRDLAGLYPIVKFWHRITFEEATFISKQAVQEVNEDLSAKLFQDAEKKYKETIKAKPDDYRGIIIHFYGLLKI